MGKVLQTSYKRLFKLESELKCSSEESYFSHFITIKPSYEFNRRIYADQKAFGLHAEVQVAGLLRNISLISPPDDFGLDLHINELVIWVNYGVRWAELMNKLNLFQCG